MTSQRNARLQQRRQELKAQQRRELKAVTDFEKSLDAEVAARLATARLVAAAVHDFGKGRAANIFALETKELAAYVKEAADAQSGDDDGSATETGHDTEPRDDASGSLSSEPETPVA